MNCFLKIAPIVLSCACVALCFSATTPSKTTNRAERKAKQDEVLKVDGELNAALLRGDVATLEKMLSKTYAFHHEREVLLWNNGSPKPSSKVVPTKKQTRDELLSGLKSGALKITALQWSDASASLVGGANSPLGEKAIVVGRMREKSTLGGKDSGGDYVLTRTYEKRDGRWECVVAAANPVVEKE